MRENELRLCDDTVPETFFCFHIFLIGIFEDDSADLLLCGGAQLGTRRFS